MNERPSSNTDVALERFMKDWNYTDRDTAIRVIVAEYLKSTGYLQVDELTDIVVDPEVADN